jgi:hypothetical protein
MLGTTCPRVCLWHTYEKNPCGSHERQGQKDTKYYEKQELILLNIRINISTTPQSVG